MSRYGFKSGYLFAISVRTDYNCRQVSECTCMHSLHDFAGMIDSKHMNVTVKITVKTMKSDFGNVMTVSSQTLAFFIILSLLLFF